MACEDNLSKYFHEGQAFLKHIVTGEETWIYFYDPESKRQSSVWKSPKDPPPLKARSSKSAGKVMLVLFFDHEGVVYHHCR